jgi:uncharacterized repeat protein (TIGR03806 family)
MTNVQNMKKTRFIIAFIVGFSVLLACKKDEEEKPLPPSPGQPSTGVSFDLNLVPYENLSQYRFFSGALKDLQPNSNVLPYDVITPLFSDYAKKKRFIWMPAGTEAEYVSDHQVLNFPDGAVMIKNFYYNNVQPENATRIIETRLIYKKNGVWHFAEYVWNEEQTEASLMMEGQNKTIGWIDEDNQLRTVNYRIPSELECFTCHKIFNQASPIGPKPQNLNKTISYSDGLFNQLEKWENVGYLNSINTESINTVVDWTDESESLHDRVRAYVDMNCAHCHREGSHCDYRPIRLAWNETTNESNLGICVNPDEFVNPQLTKIISRGSPLRSMMLFRINTTTPQYRMPLLGRTLIHEEAVALLEEYIDSLEPACP